MDDSFVKIKIIQINKDNFADLLKHSEKVARKLWDNEEDEIWNDFIKESNG